MFKHYRGTHRRPSFTRTAVTRRAVTRRAARVAAATAAAALALVPAPGFAAPPTPTTTPTASTPTATQSSPPTAGATGQAGSDQWYVSELDLRRAHGISQGAGVVVAVIDGGVDGTHPKLAGQLLPGHGTDAKSAPDGQRDDDPGGHGTAMAGIIAARGDVGDPAIVGVAPQAKILPISTGEEATTVEVARGIRWAADNGADVINLSLGSIGAALRVESAAVEYALANDVVVVASAGNAEPGDMAVNSPANIPGVIAVTGSSYNGGFWSGSVVGPEAAVAAPSPGIRAPVPARVSPDGLDTGAGTSNSSAVVSGLAALIRSEYPGLDAANVVNRIVSTAIDKGEPGRDDRFGFGVIDPLRALTADVRTVTTNPLIVSTTAEDRDQARRQAEERGDPGAVVPPPGAGSVSGQPPPAMPNPGEQGEPGEQTAASARDDSPTVADWLSSLGLAVAGGIVLGVGAHGVVSRSGRRRNRRRNRLGEPGLELGLADSSPDSAA